MKVINGKRYYTINELVDNGLISVSNQTVRNRLNNDNSLTTLIGNTRYVAEDAIEALSALTLREQADHMRSVAKSVRGG